MNLEKLKKMLEEKEGKRSAMLEKSEASTDVAEVRSIHTELQALNDEIEELRSIIADVEKTPEEKRTDMVNNEPEQRQQAFVPGVGFRSVGKSDFEISDRQKEQEDMEKRGKTLREGRSVSLASDLVIPAHKSATIKSNFNEVSSLIDMVNVVPLLGGESYTVPYEKEDGEGGYTAETTAYTSVDKGFGYASMTKSKITAYSEITEEVEKLPAANYAQLVTNGISKSVRKKINREIMTGDGSEGHLTGIFVSETIPASTDLVIDAIDNETLDDIVFGYGGDEDVEDIAVLILNKLDLAAFAKIRTNDGKKFYDIKPNGNTGTINGVPYVINSKCGAISKADTAENTYCMAYGVLSSYDLAVFSELDVKKSTDYKFKEGMVANRGSIFVGGNVTKHKGFIRVKKGA